MIPAIHSSDEAARARIRNSLDESLIVEASAGTGKTTELIRRIVRVLAAGTPVHQIVAVTFTRKAAGELKIRLREELDQARAAHADAAERSHLEDALEHLEEAAIGTIHGFCAQILRERPVEARIDPAFQELTEPEADRLRERAFDWWFQRKLEAGSDTLRRALARLAWREVWQADHPPVESLKYAGKQLVEWRDHTAAWRKEPFDRQARIDRLLAQCRALESLVRQCPRPSDSLVKSMRPLVGLISGPSDYDTLEARLVKLESDLKRGFKKGSGNFAPGVPRQQVLDAREDLLRSLAAFRTDAGADFAAALRDEMQDFVAAYNDHKRRAGKLDFLDLLLMVRNLVRDDRGVRNYLQSRYARIFVDEFQDTDPLQAEILILLSANDPAESDWLHATPVPGKLFVVGDPKQSIYKFRRADGILYEDVCEALTARGVARIHLAKSFRAVPAIQQMVNAAFAPEMTGDRDRGAARYAPLAEHAPTDPTQPAVIALPAPVAAGCTKADIDKCLPRAIAAYIEWLVTASGWKVRDPRTGARVPLEARHVCVLFRKMLDNRRDLSWDYTQALEARNIPHLLVGSKSFYHREEVETVRAALAAIEWPDDELSVFATLHGSLFAVPDDVLLRFRFEVGRLHPFRREEPGGAASAPSFAPIVEALAILAELHRQRNRRPVADTINALLEATRAHAGFLLRQAGAQVLANVSRICDLARTFELTDGLSFRGFVEELAAQAEKAESTEAPVLEEASDGVRLMTVHGAKGLEFPVVILAHPTTNIARREAERFVEGNLCATRLLDAAPRELLDNEPREHAREVAEGVRVAYVAATRARDLLVIPVIGDQAIDGWLGPLNKAIYPAADNRRAKASAPGCPPFTGNCTVECGQPDDSVHPGLHTPQAGEHRVVWWDPARLRLDVAPGFGLRQEDILAAEPAASADAGIARYRQWQQQRQQTLASGMLPAFRIAIPTEGIEEPPELRSIHNESASVSSPAERPGGRRFGILVHAILQDLDLRGMPAQIAALARVHARLLDASGEEADAAAAAVEAAWAHPLLARARAAERCHRELPIQLRLEDGRLVEGVIDLAFIEHDGWVVVDFKSDSGESTRYERQLQWYLYALSKLTGRKAVGHLLRI